MVNRRTALGRERDNDQRIELLERRLARGFALPERIAGDAKLLSTEDLDAVLESGWSVQVANADATLARHYPAEGRAGFLEVIYSSQGFGGDFVMQRYTDFQFSQPGRGNGAIWVRSRYNGTWYPWKRISTGPGAGPSSQKPADPAYWEMYFETDTNNMMVGSKSGTWRRFSGKAVHGDSSTAWANTSGTTMAGRTNVFTLPTVLESTETLLVQIDPSVSTSGYNFVGVTGLVRNPTNTEVNVRFMQLMSLTTQPMPILWQIVPAA